MDHDLRDMFAAAALVGLTAPGSAELEKSVPIETAASKTAKIAFLMADAMMAERERHINREWREGSRGSMDLVAELKSLSEIDAAELARIMHEVERLKR